MKSNILEFPTTPITDDTFERQGWEMCVESDTPSEYDEEPVEYYYWVLPLPKDNPDDDCFELISSTNDDWEELGLEKGSYAVEISNMNGLGLCLSEEELEILYRALTKEEIE